MATHCAKHDITGAECWCCEEEKINATPGARAKAYQDPEFLRKRGGLDARTAQTSKVLNALSQLTPEQLERLLSVAGAQAGAQVSPGASNVRVIA
jgi:hypothetical protein